MKPRKMQPRVMWAVVNKFRGLLAKGNMFDTREAARRDWRDVPDDLQNDCRVVRVRVTEAP